VKLNHSGAAPESRWQRLWRTFVTLHSEPNAKGYAWSEGLRGAIAVTIPSTIGMLADHQSWGILCSFAALWILLSDVGGAYRQKALTLGGAGLTVLVAYVFSAWMVQTIPNYIIGTFLWVFAAALIGVAGNAAAQVGLVSSTIVVTSVVLFVPSEFGIRLVIIMVGICWALVLSLALWPLQAYAPLFQALSDSCLKLAGLAASIPSGAAAPERPATNLQFAVAYDAFMGSLERTRNIWGAIRANRAGRTSRSLQLHALIEQLDDVAKTLVALREVLNFVGIEQWFDEFRPGFDRLSQLLSALGRELTDAVAAHGKNVDATSFQDVSRRLRNSLKPEVEDSPSTSFQRTELEKTLKHLMEQVSVLAQIVSDFNSGHATILEPPEAQYGPRPKTFDPIAEIRNNLTLRSASFRHAVRLGVTTAIAASIASAFHLTRGYWIPMTVVIVLKPNFGGTLQRSVQRISGTVLGALLASILLFLLKSSWLLLICLAVLAFLTFTLRNRNYSLFALALTPMIMVMLDLVRPTTVTDGLLRILHTLIGSGLALLCGYFLFPVLERRRLPLQLAETLRSEAAFLRAIREYLDGEEKRPLAEYRRDAALAVANAATAGQRLMSEPPHLRGNVEASMASVNYCRRILHMLAALSDYPSRHSARLGVRSLGELIAALAKAMDDLGTSLEKGTDPRSMSELVELSDQLEKALEFGSLEARSIGSRGSKTDLADKTEEWLFYHLKTVSHLTLSTREAVSRLVLSA
jgi:uncharacterized membrane protein YccC